MLSVLAALALFAAPAPAELPPLTGDIPTGKGMVLVVDKGGTQPGERPIVYQGAGCEQRLVMGDKVLHLALYWVEKLQGWLDTNAGLEEKLFAKKGTLGEVSKLVSGGGPAEKKCELALAEGWKLAATAAPGKCKAGTAPQAWWAHGGKTSAVVALAPAAKDAADACKPRASAVFFDQAGKARLRFHTDFGGAPQVTLMGDKCQNVDFSFDENVNGFKARLGSCKP
jgi:hypothetical protein